MLALHRGEENRSDYECQDATLVGLAKSDVPTSLFELGGVMPTIFFADDEEQPASHVDNIYQYLKLGKTITPAEAYKSFGCMSLSQTIGRIERKYGVIVDRKLVEVKPGTKVAKYKLG